MDKIEHDRLYREILEQNSSYYEILKSQIFHNEPNFFNRMGDPITKAEWMLLIDREEYTLVEQESLEYYTIVTSWHGLKLNFPGVPFIFETSIYMDRTQIGKPMVYPTEKHARKGHDMCVFYADQQLLNKFIEYRLC